jgi:hypothetical protein
MSGQFHDTAALSPEKGFLIPTEVADWVDAGTSLEAVQKIKFSRPRRESSLNSPVVHPVAYSIY